MKLICRSHSATSVDNASKLRDFLRHIPWVACAVLGTLIAIATPAAAVQESFDSGVELPQTGAQFEGDLFGGQADGSAGDGAAGDDLGGMDVEFDTGEFEEFGAEDFSAPDFNAEEAAQATFAALIGGLVCGSIPALLLGGLIGFWLGRRKGRNNPVG